MASDKELRALADRIGTFFDKVLPAMMTKLEDIENHLNKPMVIASQGIVDVPGPISELRTESSTTSDMPEYHGNIEPSKDTDPEKIEGEISIENTSDTALFDSDAQEDLDQAEMLSTDAGEKSRVMDETTDSEGKDDEADKPETV